MQTTTIIYVAYNLSSVSLFSGRRTVGHVSGKVMHVCHTVTLLSAYQCKKNTQRFGEQEDALVASDVTNAKWTLLSPPL